MEYRFDLRKDGLLGAVVGSVAGLLISQWLLRLYVPSIESALVAPARFGFIFLVGRQGLEPRTS